MSKHSKPTTQGTRTPQEVLEWLEYNGISVAQWAREHGFSVGLTRSVLRGRPGRRGMSHNIAVALGIKRGVPTALPGRSDADLCASRGQLNSAAQRARRQAGNVQSGAAHTQQEAA
ncbi:hypothetical protein [Extensimonas vulgaris]|uniref:Gp16 family phage-associated protein n=1 Tax=Extensimonas vulgaris TaxID=1031594 RepID=A0A369AMW8_9BURK|nr:hypothetical protein [Extensimonas vulgaris]RCX10720.1 gp16 family phage-associated protein [Extensimonas vulgaris]TWI41362.1 gp16 family phage-associated protein [Extensimonas vulgaris]TXD16829.1 hypothetical protein FUT63_02225 [Extensimonas vulgaris]